MFYCNFLDVAVVPTAQNDIIRLIALTLAVTLVEALLLTAIKYQPLRHSLWQSLVINALSTALGIVIRLFTPFLFLEGDFYLLKLFLLTLIIEFPILYLLNKMKPVSKTALACLIINVVSYLLLILYINFFN
ncbi:MAG: hypothetical protein N2747_07395 [Chitinophagaceae bacterium]|nr:hypothetical protein [Chitinophagaceae bacterium]